MPSDIPDLGLNRPIAGATFLNGAGSRSPIRMPAPSAIDQAVRAVRELAGVRLHAADLADFPGPPLKKLGL